MSFDPLQVTPIGVVVGGRTEATDDNWGSDEAEIRLDESRFTSEALAGLADFSHIDVVFVFDRVDESNVNLSARHPRGRGDWPLVGIFAQRAKARPNRIGVTTCELIAVEGTTLKVRGLDAIDGTPVLDVKPYMAGFAPRGLVREPEWATELMAGYW
jgi:tRNA-Thr(GGU) m(6)t(6)A37 methyltransferase TsaA